MPEMSASAGLTTNLMSAEKHGNEAKFDFDEAKITTIGS